MEEVYKHVRKYVGNSFCFSKILISTDYSLIVYESQRKKKIKLIVSGNICFEVKGNATEEKEIEN